MSDAPKFELEIKLEDSRISKTVMKDSFTIGRAPTCDVVIEHPQISREHIRIDYSNNKLFIVDLGSSHGTSINGRSLTAKTAYIYHPNDELILARKAATIVIKQAPMIQTVSDYSVPDMPIPFSSDTRATKTHFLGATNKVTPQIDSSEQMKDLLQKREAEEKALKDLAENQKIRHEQLEQILAQLSTLDEKQKSEKSRLQDILREVTKVEQDIREARQHLDKINIETKDLFSVKEQVRNEITALDKHKHSLSEMILKLDQEKLNQQKKLQEVQDKLFAEQKHALEFSEKRTVFESLIERLTSDQKSLTESCGDLRKQSQQIGAEVKGLENQKQNLEASLASLSTRLSDANVALVRSEQRVAELESLKTEEPELRLSVERGREQLAKLNSEIRLIETQKAEVASAKSHAEEELSHFRSKKETSQKELDSLNRQIASAQHTLNDTVQRTNKLDDELRQLESETRKSNKAVADKMAEVNKMELLLSDLRTQLASNKENISKLQEERKSLDQYVTQSRTEIEKERRSVLAAAEDVAKKLIDQKKAEGAQILKDAKNNARTWVDENQKETLLKTHQAEERANKTIIEAQEEANRKIADAEEEATRKINEAEQRAQEIIKEAEGKGQSMESHFEKEKREKQLNLDQDIVVMRLKETEELRRIHALEKKKWAEVKETEVRTVREILKAQLRLILGEKIASTPQTEIELIAKKIEETFIDVLDTEFLEKGSDTSAPSPIFHPDAFKKEKLTWGQWAYKRRVTLSALVILASIPLLKKGVIEYHRLNVIAQEQNIKEINQRREVASRVEFETTPDYKNSFLDNMLYTADFAETISDPNYKDELVKKLDVFVNKELDLHEEIVPIYMGKEAELVLNILNIKEKIRQENKKTSMEAMRKFESEFDQVMLENLKTQSNLRQFKKFLKDFYVTYRETH